MYPAISHKRRNQLFCVLIFLAAVILSAVQSYAGEVSGISIHKSQSTNGQEQAQIEVLMSVGSQQEPHVFFITGDAPRIVIDFKQTNLSSGLRAKMGGQTYFGGDLNIEKIRYARRGKHDFRMVVDLVQGGEYVSHSYDQDRLRIVVSGNISSEATRTPVVINAPKDTDTAPVPRLNPRTRTIDDTFTLKSSSFQNPSFINASIKTPVVSQVKATIDTDPAPVPRLKRSRRAKYMKKPLIVIDPGHGGHDPGAVGAGKTHEEDVTLKAGLELRRQLLASGKYKVVMTRSTDRYVDHDKRVLIARKAGADLFISIHADSTANNTARGASVYTLAARAEGRAHRMVSHQNWVANVDLSQKSAPVSNILVDLAQRKTLTQSGKFADILLTSLKPSTKLVGNSHRRAGYYVLLAPDVPAVLLELGFLSNAQDEKLLKTAKHRKKLMTSVKRAIDRYFKP